MPEQKVDTARCSVNKTNPSSKRAIELCSRLWCWLESVLMALPPTTSPNSVFLLPLLQVVNISGQPGVTDLMQVHRV